MSFLFWQQLAVIFAFSSLLSVGFGLQQDFLTSPEALRRHDSTVVGQRISLDLGWMRGSSLAEHHPQSEPLSSKSLRRRAPSRDVGRRPDSYFHLTDALQTMNDGHYLYLALYHDMRTMQSKSFQWRLLVVPDSLLDWDAHGLEFGQVSRGKSILPYIHTSPRIAFVRLAHLSAEQVSKITWQPQPQSRQQADTDRSYVMEALEYARNTRLITEIAYNTVKFWDSALLDNKAILLGLANYNPANLKVLLSISYHGTWFEEVYRKELQQAKSYIIPSRLPRPHVPGGKRGQASTPRLGAGLAAWAPRSSSPGSPSPGSPSSMRSQRPFTDLSRAISGLGQHESIWPLPTEGLPSQSDALAGPSRLPGSASSSSSEDETRDSPKTAKSRKSIFGKFKQCCTAPQVLPRDSVSSLARLLPRSEAICRPCP